MRKIALAMIAIGIAIAIAGGSLKVFAWKGQEDALTRWQAESHDAGKPALFTRLSFPAQGQDFIVADGATEDNLLRGPARVDWSVAPGQAGNCIIAAHRDTHFRILRELHKGEEIWLERSGGSYRYRIVSFKVIHPDDTTYYQPTTGPVLTLVTCYPFWFFGKAPERFIVRAELLGSNS